MVGLYGGMDKTCELMAELKLLSLVKEGTSVNITRT